ncbi:MAG: ComEA family DNA-binding protein [Phycisphaerales bacterium]|nr:ComEA family DNA-binding protein [Phycisphaerales bacterium]
MPAPATAKPDAHHPARSTRLLTGIVLTLAAAGGLALSTTREPLPDTPPAAAAVRTPLLNLNTADAAELQLLPRIGPALSARIIEDRDANGPFASLEDLQRVRGIGPRTIEIIRPHATTE